MSDFRPGITIITPTGDRWKCLKRLQFQIERQTLMPHQWVIGDNGVSDTAIRLTHTNNYRLDIARSRDLADLPQAKSFTGNLIQIIPYVLYDHIIVMEDDDWYSPKYVQKTMERFYGDRNGLVGEARAYYYNVRFMKWRRNGNKHRASLCQTAFKARFLGKFLKCCQTKRDSAFVDARFWEMAKERDWPRQLFSDQHYSVGIKGLPGRRGIGIGHRPGPSFKKDRNFAKLIELIGQEDAEYYMKVRKLV